MQRDIWETNYLHSKLNCQAVQTSLCLPVRVVYCLTCLSLLYCCLCAFLLMDYISECILYYLIHMIRASRAALSAGLITATWQAPTVPDVQLHTSLKSIQLSCVWLCVHVTATVHHQNTERLSTMTHLSLWTLEGRGHMLTHRKQTSNTVI